MPHRPAPDAAPDYSTMTDAEFAAHKKTFFGITNRRLEP
jgi:hypothetical protein